MAAAGQDIARTAPQTDRDAVRAYRFDVMGCSGRIRIAGVSDERADGFIIDAVRWLRDLEARLTRFSDQSLVGRINRCAGSGAVAVDADCLAVLDAADWAWSLSDGRLDATILPLIRFWHDADRTRWPSQAEIAAARALVDWTAVQRRSGSIGLAHPGMALDLGGVGKEWAVDQLIDRAAVSGIDHCLVELGGDCRARGRQGHVPGWWVTLPGANTALLLGNEAIATSGIGTRYRLVDGRLVPHLIDARSGQPACGAIRFASIVAPNCLLAGIRSSDICLLAQADPQCIHERAGALPAWCGGSDDRIYADQRLLARMHTIGPSRMSA